MVQGTICITYLLYDDSKVCRFPYCLRKTAIALLYPYSGLSFMKFLIRSFASPLVYWINWVNLPFGSSIFFLTHSLNIDISMYIQEGSHQIAPNPFAVLTALLPTCATSVVMLWPSKWIFLCLVVFALIIVFIEIYSLRTGRMTDPFFITITPTRI